MFWTLWKTQSKCFKEIQSKSTHFYLFIIFYSIASNTIGDEELEAALRVEYAEQRNAQRNQSMAQKPGPG